MLRTSRVRSHLTATLCTVVVFLLLALAATRHGAPVAAQAITYVPGWNLVAGPDGAVLVGASDPIYTLQPGDTDYQGFPATTPLHGGWGYWAYFLQAGSLDSSHAVTTSTYTVATPAGQWVMAGNPSSTGPVAISGALAAYAYTPDAGFVAATAVDVGRGAWVYANGAVTVGAAPSATPTSVPTTSPAVTSAPSATPAGGTCTGRCSYTGNGSMTAKQYLTRSVGGTSVNSPYSFTRTVSFDFQITVQGGQVSGQGTWSSAFQSDCPVPPQKDALTVSGQQLGPFLALTFTNNGVSQVAMPDCPAVRLPNVMVYRFLAGDMLVVDVDAHDGATGTATTYPGIGPNAISFDARVTLHAASGQ